MAPHRPRKGIELYREDGGYVIVVDLGAFRPEDIAWQLVDGVLSIDAEPPADAGAEPFHRQIGLPGTVAGQEATATMRDGVLEVSVPLAEEGEDTGGDVERAEIETA